MAWGASQAWLSSSASLKNVRWPPPGHWGPRATSPVLRTQSYVFNNLSFKKNGNKILYFKYGGLNDVCVDNTAHVGISCHCIMLIVKRSAQAAQITPKRPHHWNQHGSEAFPSSQLLSATLKSHIYLWKVACKPSSTSILGQKPDKQGEPDQEMREEAPQLLPSVGFSLAVVVILPSVWSYTQE